MQDLTRRFPAEPLHSSLDGLTLNPLCLEKVVNVRSAEVVVADYKLIRNDFFSHLTAEFGAKYCSMSCQRCAEQGGACNQAIDNWLIKNAAVVSVNQTGQQDVNSEISADDANLNAYRPPGYGRALVVQVFDRIYPECANFIDVKGAGVGPGITPTNDVHGNGLEYLGFALADYLYGWLVDLVFSRTFPTYYVVPTYAVIDLGFDIVGGWAGTGPAALHIRRAHFRHPTGLQLPLSGSDEERVACHMELLLRLFGLTSATNSTSFRLDRESGSVSYFGGPIIPTSEAEVAKLDQIKSHLNTGALEVSNIQLIRGSDWSKKTAQLVDFGNINGRNHFRHPFAIGARDAIYRISRIVNVGDQQFVQPIPKHSVNGSLFARETVNALAFFAAQGFRVGRLGRRDILRLLLTGIKCSGLHRKERTG